MFDLLRDPSFTKTLARLAIPIALQQLIISALSLVTVMMIGQLGDTAVAAVGLGNQILFLYQLLLFGIGSSVAIFVAQFWGNRDLRNISRVLGVALGATLLGALAFTIVALVFPEQALGVYSSDPAVIELGSQYLRILGWCFFPMGIMTCYAVTLRSTGNVRVPVTVSSVALTLGAAFNFVLIFGELGFPALGVPGSAIGTVIARFLECGLVVFFTYAAVDSPAAVRVRDMLALDGTFLRRVFKTSYPVLINEILWALGTTTYSIVYARISTEAIAAVSIAGTIENIAFVPFQGLAIGAAIMIGHRIGADEEHKALTYAMTLLFLTVAGGLLVGGIIYLSADSVLGLYKIAPASRQIARDILTVVSIALWARVSNIMIIVGILRAGGDTRFSSVVDVGTLWLIGLPAAVVGAFVFKLPAPLVYLLAMSDEVCKFCIATTRVLSRQWITNLARQHARVEPTK